MSLIQTLREKISPAVQENVPMAKYTTLKVGGPAEYFFEALTASDAVRAAHAAKELGIPFFAFGGGSNTLVSDEGVKGLVLRMGMRSFRFENNQLIADAGAPSGLVSVKSVDAGLAGLEWMVGLPGTVGGAVRGNAGMFGGEVKDNLVSALILDGEQERTLTAEECQFSYRDSIFKKIGETPKVILSATFQLKPFDPPSDQDVAKSLLRKHLMTKKDEQPVERPSAGCMFTNWKPADEADVEKLRGYLDLHTGDPIPRTPHGAVPSGWIIDRVGLKGTAMGKVSVSDKHANFMVVGPDARAADIIALAALVKTRVRNATHGIVDLREEVEYVGF